jgi:SRSO17 transposase
MALEAGGVEQEDVRGWAQGLDGLAIRISPHFARPEARDRALEYIQGLLSPAERKNAWQLAEIAGDSNPYGLQNLLGRAEWDQDAVRDVLRGYVLGHLGDTEGALVFDETSFPKKGKKSVGVARQYCGSLGKRENCQVGVLLAYSSPRGHAFIDRELYLPKEWTGDVERLKAAGVPQEVAFATKPEIGRRMLQRAFDAGATAGWILADEVYGGDYKLRSALEERCQRYVLGVASNQYAWAGFYQLRVDELVRGLGEDSWRRLSCGEGSKGPRVYDWASTRLNCPVEGWERWALARRSLADPDELAYYLAFVPAGTSLDEVVRAAGRRWTIEEAIEQAKGEVGLDQYEVRSWRGWYRHVTLSMLAHAYLAATRAEATPEVAKGGALRAQRASSLTEFKRRRGLAG